MSSVRVWHLNIFAVFSTLFADDFMFFLSSRNLFFTTFSVKVTVGLTAWYGPSWLGSTTSLLHCRRLQELTSILSPYTWFELLGCSLQVLTWLRMIAIREHNWVRVAGGLTFRILSFLCPPKEMTTLIEY